MEGVKLTVKTDAETLNVHIGPKWYLGEQKVTFQPKTTVSITGSRVTWRGEPVIMASEIRQKGHTLKLRDAKGSPIWGGGL